MLNEALLNPKQIAVIGGSDDLHKPGGKILKNIREGGFAGKIYVVNPSRTDVQGLPTYASVDDLPCTNLAVLAIPAQACLETVTKLCKKGTKAFIIISAGFGEESHEGKLLEQQIADVIQQHKATLIGPNCIGMATATHKSMFTSPIPEFHQCGCDIISSSGATAVFIIESGMAKGLRFANIFSVGNSAVVGVEDILEHLDENYNPNTCAPVKLLYLESIPNPDKLLKHAASLIRKGCKIAAIKAGASEAGSKAASSHTGAMASSDLAVDALFRKAGIIRCNGREELTTVASVFQYKTMNGPNMAVITHAGGPAVLLTDALSTGGLSVPSIAGEKAQWLKTRLYAGSSVNNPIDFLATGTAEQLGTIIDACENDFDNIDGMAVIFGSPGLFPVREVYELLDKKIAQCQKPIYPVLPSVVNVADDIRYFTSLGHVNFPDEVQLGNALSKIYNTRRPAEEQISLENVDIPATRRLIDQATDGWLPPEATMALLKCAGIPTVAEFVVRTETELLEAAKTGGYPCVLKVVGPLHKTDVRGVVLNIHSDTHLKTEFHRLMKITDASGVLVQPMLKGTELFIGAKYEPRFGHIILCGTGGIFVEVFRDLQAGLAPLTWREASEMIKGLKSYPLIAGTRGQKGINEPLFTRLLVQLSTVLRFATEIKEMDINPLIGTKGEIFAVDARIRIEK